MMTQQPAAPLAYVPLVQALVMLQSVKVYLPDQFNGDRQQLSAFFSQLTLYFGFYTNQFPLNQPEKKILFATMMMRGLTYEWFERYLKDYLKSLNNLVQCKDETNYYDCK